MPRIVRAAKKFPLSRSRYNSVDSPSIYTRLIDVELARMKCSPGTYMILCAANSRIRDAPSECVGSGHLGGVSQSPDLCHSPDSTHSLYITYLKAGDTDMFHSLLKSMYRKPIGYGPEPLRGGLMKNFQVANSSIKLYHYASICVSLYKES